MKDLHILTSKGFVVSGNSMISITLFIYYITERIKMKYSFVFHICGNINIKKEMKKDQQF